MSRVEGSPIPWLTPAEVVAIHDRILAVTDGADGVRDEAGLASAVLGPLGSAFGQDAYPSLFGKIGALVFRINGNHVFSDGNKRTSLIAADTILRMNGWSIEESAEVEQFFWSIAEGNESIGSITTWLEDHSVRYVAPRGG